MITIYFWSRARLRAAMAAEVPYQIPFRYVSAEEAEAEAARAPDTWTTIHSFFDGFGWENRHRRQTVFQSDLSRLRNYIVARNLPGITIEFANPTDEQLFQYYDLVVAMQAVLHRERAEREALNPPPPLDFRRISIPRIANRPALPSLREILSANPLRIEP